LLKKLTNFDILILKIKDSKIFQKYFSFSFIKKISLKKGGLKILGFLKII